MLYTIAKHVHVTCVVLSMAGFCLRGLLHLQEKSALARRLLAWRGLRILPHVNDTLLLAAGISLVVLIQQYPFVDDWLTAKIFGLITYIILGALALQPGRPPSVRLAAGVMGVMVFGWIVSVALAKHPLGVFA